jgi:glutaredoxin
MHGILFATPQPARRVAPNDRMSATRLLIVLVLAVVLIPKAAPLLVFLRGGYDYDAARQGEVVLLSTAGCSWCAQMKTLLWAGGIEYRELDVERDAEGRRRYEEAGASGVPVLFVGDEIVRGYDPGAVRAAFAAAGADAVSNRTEGLR